MAAYAFARPPAEESARHWRRAAAWTVAVGVAHFALPVSTHLHHGWHILLGGLFLVPIFHGAAADWKRGGMLAAAAVSLVYGAHLLWSWRSSAMANLDQVAVLGFYLVAGLAAGELIMREALRRWQRDEVIRSAYLAEQAREREMSPMEVRSSEETPGPAEPEAGR